jgi:hypothetical protein
LLLLLYDYVLLPKSCFRVQTGFTELKRITETGENGRVGLGRCLPVHVYIVAHSGGCWMEIKGGLKQ